MSYTKLPYIVEGEIIKLAEQVKDTDPIRYVCKVIMENGSEIILPNVQAATLFGGIGDYLQIRSRTSFDVTKEIQKDPRNGEKFKASVGDRVYISFINGSFMKPIIIGYAQHPNQTNEFKDNFGTDAPAAILQYLGIRVEVNKDGELKFIHKGAPEIKFAPKGEGLLGALSTLSSVSSLPNGLKDNNQAITNQSEDEITLFEMLKGGIFRIRDAEGQIIEIDRIKKRIYLSNNDLKSTEDVAATGGLQLSTNTTDAEYLLLDKNKEIALLNARKIAQIYSFDKRKDVTEGNHEHKIGGNNTIIIGGDEDVKISGNRSYVVAGNDDKKISGNWTVTSTGDIQLDGSLAKLKLSKGKVGLGGPTAELLDLFDQEIDAFLNNASSLVLTAVGPGVLNPAVVTLLTNIKILLGTIKGGI